MKALVLVAILHITGALTGLGADAKKPADNYETLRTTTVFAFGGVGVAGTTVPAETAFNEVVRTKDASATFQKLLATATPEGQLYALVGLYRIDHKIFLDAAQPYLQSETEVNTAAGCMMYKQPTKGIVGRIKAGDYKGPDR